MARYEIAEIEAVALGQAPGDAESFFELGMMYSTGSGMPVDLVSAHKWFNIAAMKGCADAARLRREIAAEMADAEIGQAQMAARQWLKSHPQARAETLMRVAA
jgi:TPR repeat protein